MPRFLKRRKKKEAMKTLEFLFCLPKIENFCLPIFCNNDVNPIGPTGIIGYGLLQTDYFEGYTSTERTYLTPLNTTLLHVQLWGAGGGGGGAFTYDNSSVSLTGGGGGAGGYAEAWIMNPTGSYTFVLQAGGQGGINSEKGGDASASWFSSPDEMLAGGGYGGECGGNNYEITISQGGRGGSAIGSLVTLASTGGAGMNGIAHGYQNIKSFGEGGIGGCNFAGSGVSHVSSNSFTSINGNASSFGQGGSGALSLQISNSSTPPKIARGGNGGAAFLCIEAFGTGFL